MNQTKVLVIDDDPMMLDLASYQLQSRGYEVTTAETGEEGLKLFAEHRHEKPVEFEELFVLIVKAIESCLALLQVPDKCVEPFSKFFSPTLQSNSCLYQTDRKSRQAMSRYYRMHQETDS